MVIKTLKPAARACSMPPFMVMEVLERAQSLERQGIDIVHMEVGEPGFDTPLPVVEAAHLALDKGHTHYTHSMGMPELRAAIARWHSRCYGTLIDPDSIVVTSGTSPAMLLAFMAICEPGDEIIISDPYYACYPNLITFAGGRPVTASVSAEDRFQLSPRSILGVVTEKTRAILINSPSNPVGSIMPPETMKELAELNILLISDEIYHGLVYTDRAHSIREFTAESIVINGFSKLFAMTGWRLGYLILPEPLVRVVQKMQQNFFISACHFAQTAALAAFEEESSPYVQAMTLEYDRRRRLLLERLPEVGLNLPVTPTGAFYVFADARPHCQARGLSSYDLAFDILEKAHVAVTPGSDFGPGGEGFLRLSYAAPYHRLAEGLNRLERYLKG